jgi:hypothetical protein
VANQLTDADHGRHVLGHYGYIDLQRQMVTAAATDCHPHPFSEKSDARKTRRKRFRLGSLPCRRRSQPHIHQSRDPNGRSVCPGRAEQAATVGYRGRTAADTDRPPNAARNTRPAVRAELGWIGPAGGVQCGARPDGTGEGA